MRNFTVPARPFFTAFITFTTVALLSYWATVIGVTFIVFIIVYFFVFIFLLFCCFHSDRRAVFVVSDAKIGRFSPLAIVFGQFLLKLTRHKTKNATNRQNRRKFCRKTLKFDTKILIFDTIVIRDDDDYLPKDEIPWLYSNIFCHSGKNGYICAPFINESKYLCIWKESFWQVCLPSCSFPLRRAAR